MSIDKYSCILFQDFMNSKVSAKGPPTAAAQVAHTVDRAAEQKQFGTKRMVRMW
jgi:hypothetical protein